MLDLDNADHQHVDRRLRTEAVAWLGTTSPAGRPHHVPVWFLWEDPTITVFSPQTAHKVVHIAKNPAVTLTLDSADHGNDIVIVEGDATLEEPDESGAARTPGFVEKYAGLMADMPVADWARIFDQCIVIDVTKIIAWTKPGSELRYQVVRRSGAAAGW